MKPDRPLVDASYQRYADRSVKERHARQMREYERKMREYQRAQVTNQITAALLGSPAGNMVTGNQAIGLSGLLQGMEPVNKVTPADLGAQAGMALKQVEQDKFVKDYLDRNAMAPSPRKSIEGPLKTVPDPQFSLPGGVTTPDNFKFSQGMAFPELDVSYKTSTAKGGVKAKTVADVVLGEAVNGTRKQRYADMVQIASVIANRAQQLGVTPEQVVSAPGEFSAYNKALPPGVGEFRDLAQQALKQVETSGPINNATFYATPDAVKGLPDGLTHVANTTGHQYYSDPQGRPIGTSLGMITPGAPVAPPASSIAPSVNAGPAGYAYADLVPAKSVSTTSIGTAATPDLPTVSASPTVDGPKGFEALAPHGLLGDAGTIDFAHPEQTGINPGLESSLMSASRELGQPLGITSGYRSPAHNRAVGGAKGSYHMRGMAADIDMTGMSVSERQGLVQALAETGIGNFIGYSKSPNMLHVDMRPRIDEATPHFMFDKTTAGMVRAPGWFKDLAAVGGVMNPAEAPAPEARPGWLDAGPIAGPDRQMPSGSVRQSLADAFPSLGPDRQMPSGDVRQSIADAFPSLDAPGLASLAPDRQMPSGAVQASLEAPRASPSARAAFDAVASADLGNVSSFPSRPTGPLGPSGGLWSSLGSTLPNPPTGPDPAHQFVDRISAPINSGLVAPATPDSAIAGMQIEGGLQRAGLLGLPAGLPSLSATPSFNSLPPDRMMPMGAVRPSLAPAFAPARTIGIAPSLLSPNLISPVPGTPPSAVIAPTPQPNTISTALAEVPNTPMNNFPAAPKPPSAWDDFKYSATPVVNDTLLGAKLAGPLGALGGAAVGLMGDRLPGFHDLVGPGFDAAVPSKDRFSTGTGLTGIMGAMNGPFGAQGFSASNPGMSFTNLGPNMGGLRRSEKFGWTEVVGPDGSVRGIQYDNPTGGGVFGSLSRALGGMFGGSGHDATKAERDSGKYSGPGLW